MKVLSVSSEIYPLIKTGGLADVAGALPLALKSHEIDMRSLLPGYTAVMGKIGNAQEVAALPVFGQEAKVLFCEYEGLQLYVLDIPAFYQRPGGPYTNAAGKDHLDNWKRFAALSIVGAKIAGGLLPDWKPDLVHAHDWQAAVTPVYMRYGLASDIPSVMTVHNIAFQGQFGPDIFPEMELPEEAFSIDGIEYYGDVGFLKGGMQLADAVTTVSPSYAAEILTPEFGMGLEGLIQARAETVYGIVNGIDTDVWDPVIDPHIATSYSYIKRKRRLDNRSVLSAYFDVDEDDGPLFCVISRLTWQKGIDLLIAVIDDIVAGGGKIVFLGSGDKEFETAITEAAQRHKGRVGVRIGYDEPLSHLMQAGADAILIPSRFEPCGLTQLYALRYGCVPVVAHTGGLADTVIDANAAAVSAGVATGFQFSPVSVDGLRGVLRRVFSLWDDKRNWAELQKNGMKSDVSWEKSAANYADLYKKLVMAKSN